MYRRSKFLEVLIEIRQEMAREADYDVDFFTEIARSGNSPRKQNRHPLTDAPSGTNEPDPHRSNRNDGPKT